VNGYMREASSQGTAQDATHPLSRAPALGPPAPAQRRVDGPVSACSAASSTKNGNPAIVRALLG
jgi:hypothetical protein